MNKVKNQNWGVWFDMGGLSKSVSGVKYPLHRGYLRYLAGGLNPQLG